MIRDRLSKATRAAKVFALIAKRSDWQRPADLVRGRARNLAYSLQNNPYLPDAERKTATADVRDLEAAAQLLETVAGLPVAAAEDVDPRHVGPLPNADVLEQAPPTEARIQKLRLSAQEKRLSEGEEVAEEDGKEIVSEIYALREQADNLEAALLTPQ